jgi:hypothetical protein
MAADEFIEVAYFAARSLVLHHKCQVPVVEVVEPLIPGDFFQRLSAAVSRKIETDHAYIFRDPGTAHTRRTGAAIFSPLSDFIVIS